MNLQQSRFNIFSGIMPWLSDRISVVWPVRIWQQLFLVLILFAVVPLLILGSVLIRTSQNAVKVSVLRDHRELAVRAAGEVSEFIQKPKELLITVASIIGVNHTDPWRQETAIVELVLRSPMFQRVASVDMDGQEVASSELGGRRRSWNREPSFLKAREGEIYVGPVQIYGTDTPVTQIAVPVTRWGRTAGVLVAEVNLRGMWDIVDGIHIGLTGFACVIDRAGTLISHPDKKLVLENDELSQEPVVKQVLSGKTGSRETVDEHNHPWLVSYAPVRDPGWGLVIFQSAAEAYAFSKIMRIQSWIFVLLSILSALVISMALAHFMSRPLNMILEGIQRITQKDFEHPLPVGRADEIGEILSSFNRMSLQLKEAQQAEKLSIIGKAAASIAHELKNSLVLVNTYIQLLSERYKEKKFVEEFSRVVPRELDAWNGMLRNLTEYARISRYDMEPLDLQVFFDDVAGFIKTRVNLHDIALQIHVTPELPVIRANAEKLRQVILNLLSNAVESASPQGRVAVTVDLASREEEGALRYVRICVDNSGPPIPAHEITRIFEPFYTTKDSGLGLGLAICREIVERHNGFIRVSSTKEEGTSFAVWLPLGEGKKYVL